MDVFRDEIGSCCPVKRFCNVVVSVEVFFDRRFQSLDASEAAPDSFCRDVREESFNQLAPIGVKCTWQRGEQANQRFTDFVLGVA